MMRGILADTNVLSELAKPSPNASVVGFIASCRNMYVSVITVHEVMFGLQQMPQGARRQHITRLMQDYIAAYGADHMLPIDEAPARIAAQMRAQAAQTGRTLTMADAFIAATAQAHGLTLATRNVRDFYGLDVLLINPWLA